jgi:hypothetical protein
VGRLVSPTVPPRMPARDQVLSVSFA